MPLACLDLRGCIGLQGACIPALARLRALRSLILRGCSRLLTRQRVVGFAPGNWVGVHGRAAGSGSEGFTAAADGASGRLCAWAHEQHITLLRERAALVSGTGTGGDVLECDVCFESGPELTRSACLRGER